MFGKPENSWVSRGPLGRAEEAGTQLVAWKAEEQRHQAQKSVAPRASEAGGQEDYLKREQFISLLCSLGWAGASRAQQET